jgi:D-alanyl-lipoteichoic acid acyltransferase DltB (MBOAT superfamily)
MQNFISQIDCESLIRLFTFDAHQPLLFNTGLFMLLFVVFLGIYEIVRLNRTLKLLFVILFSLFFYYKSSGIYCAILLGVCASDYILGRLMGIATANWMRRAIVALNVVCNVGMLIYFKYFNLLYETFAEISDTNFSPLDIALPAGISFFTFRSISYIVDLYRGKLEPCSNVLDYVFFMTFFPPLLAGPVVRAVDLLPQIKENKTATRAMIGEGLFMIMCGLVKKVMIADYISGNFVDRIFENPSLYSGLENLVGTFSFTLQLYCDFSGYSDMAIGIALLLGYRFKDNFNSPFKSRNPSEFWRRWHISLSTWLRDYIYIPLGGNRKGNFHTYINLFITMVIGGIWHGASWMYLLWGAFNGILLAAHKKIKQIWHPGYSESVQRIIDPINILITFTLVVFGFTFFRSTSLENLSDMATQILTSFHADIAPQFVMACPMVVTAIVVGLALHFSPASWQKKLSTTYTNSPILVQAIVLAIVIFVVIQTRQSELVPFVYLQY